MTTTADSMLAYHRDGAVATVTIHHPPANTLTPELLGELSQVFEGFAKDDAIKAVVLTGTGRFFVAGADIRLLASIASSQEGESIARQGQAILNRIESLEKPVIAAINGVCLGEAWNWRCVVTSGSWRRTAAWVSRKSIWGSCRDSAEHSGFLESSANPRRWN